MTNGLELNPEENRRYMALCAGHGNRSGTGIFPGTRTNQKITVNQLLELKRLHKQGLENKAIQTELNLSEYIVRMALIGHYDHILPTGKNKRRI